MKMIPLMAVLAALASAPLAAQNHGGGQHAEKKHGSAQHAEKKHEGGHAALRASLKLTPAQEGAWQAFEKAHDAAKPQLPPAPAANARAPQIVDWMAEEARAKAAAADAHARAVKDFYAKLTPEQQAEFDKHVAGHLPGKKHH